MATKNVNTRMQQVVKTQAEKDNITLLKGEMCFISDAKDLGSLYVGGLYNSSGGGFILPRYENFGKGLAIGAGNGRVTQSSIIIGAYAGENISPSAHSRIIIGGYEPGRSWVDTGLFNVTIGSNAGEKNTTGDYNTYVGMSAGANNVAGESNTAIGYNALILNTFSNSTGIGILSNVSGDRQIQIGGSSTIPYAYAALQIRSDARDKVDIVDEDLGVEFINKLRPIKHKWDLREEYRTPYPNRKDFNSDEEFKSAMDSYKVETFEQLLRKKDGSKKGNREHHGLIAQELKCTLDELGIDFAGYQDHSINGGEDVKSIAYEQFVPVLIKAVQELSARIDEIENL